MFAATKYEQRLQEIAFDLNPSRNNTLKKRSGFLVLLVDIILEVIEMDEVLFGGVGEAYELDEVNFR